MKKILCGSLVLLVLFMFSGASWAITEMPRTQGNLQAAPNARTIEFAFVFDGASDKNKEVLQTFQKTITRSLLPDYKASFPQDLIFTGDWSEKKAAAVTDSALNSRAFMVISLGYMSSAYLNSKKNLKKYVVTVDEYGLRDMGSAAFFNPVKQSVNDFILFKKLVPTQHKTAILMNDNFYKTQKNWNAIISKKLAEKKCDLDFVVIPVCSKNLSASLNKIPRDVDSVFVTPMFNLSVEQRKDMYAYINGRKLPSFSSVGKEDVELGALLGTSTPDLDRKLAEATTFSIRGVLHGNTVKNEKIPFYDDKVIFYNSDTGEALNYAAPLRLLNNAQVLSNKKTHRYDLSYVLNTMDTNNLDIKRKTFLVSAARRATTAAYLRYLPTFRMDLGYQTYNSAYALSYSDVPTKVGQFVMALDQVLYSPDLVTNIIVKHKKLKFDKAERLATEQNIGHELCNMYIETLMLENMIRVQEEYVKEVRENLAIARVREKSGYCGREEALRWAGQVSEAEKKLLEMKADFANVKIAINKLLYKDQTEKFDFMPLTAKDPAFFTSELHIINHVSTPEKLAKFTDMLIKEVIYLSPETTKLRAAIAMKKAEMSNYAQKFIMPNAKMSLEWGKQFDRHLPYEAAGVGQMQQMPLLGYPVPPGYLDKESFRFLIAAQWKPIEGGTKIAEIARCKAELNELNAYLEQVNTELEMNVRQVVNRAISKYFMIEKSYKAMFAEAENYQTVKAKYLVGKAPIAQVADAQELYVHAKVEALNSQYDFFKELVWVQRGLVCINWAKANDRAKNFIKNIPSVLPAVEDFSL